MWFFNTKPWGIGASHGQSMVFCVVLGCRKKRPARKVRCCHFSSLRSPKLLFVESSAPKNGFFGTSKVDKLDRGQANIPPLVGE